MSRVQKHFKLSRIGGLRLHVFFLQLFDDVPHLFPLSLNLRCVVLIKVYGLSLVCSLLFPGLPYHEFLHPVVQEVNNDGPWGGCAILRFSHQRAVRPLDTNLHVAGALNFRFDEARYETHGVVFFCSFWDAMYPYIVASQSRLKVVASH